MRESLKSGVSFGITSGIITTLGIILGLNASTHSKLAVIGGIISIATADGLSEAMGMHIAKKSESKHMKYVWESTFALLIAKFLMTMTFAIAVLLLELSTGIAVNIVYGLALLVILSYFVSNKKKRRNGRTYLSMS